MAVRSTLPSTTRSTKLQEDLHGGPQLNKTQLAPMEAAKAAKSLTAKLISCTEIPPEMLERGRLPIVRTISRTLLHRERKMVGEFGSQIIQFLPRIWDALKQPKVKVGQR